MFSLAAHLHDLQARGRYHFTTREVVQAAGGSRAAAQASIRRLKLKGHVASPYQGFHLIVPPEYRSLGCLPADQFIPNLMEHLGEPYYVSLLSAAAYHGASHQKPQVFQVMVRKPRREIRCGKVTARFFARQDLQDTPVVEFNTLRGILKVASSEATALELVGYLKAGGGPNMVSTVLRELVQKMEGAALARAAEQVPVAWVQRLGHLLEFVEAYEIARVLGPVLRNRRLYTIPLLPGESITGAPRDRRWRVAENTSLEPDL